MTSAVAGTRSVDSGIIEHVDIVVVNGFAGFQGLEDHALDHRTVLRIAEDLFGDFPFATIGDRSDLPQHGAFVELSDVMLRLAAFLITPGPVGVGDQELQIDVLYLVEGGIENFGQDTLGASEVNP